MPTWVASALASLNVKDTRLFSAASRTEVKFLSGGLSISSLSGELGEAVAAI